MENVITPWPDKFFYPHHFSRLISTILWDWKLGCMHWRWSFSIIVHNNSTLYALYNLNNFISIPSFNFESEAFSLIWALCPTRLGVLPPAPFKILFSHFILLHIKMLFINNNVRNCVKWQLNRNYVYYIELTFIDISSFHFVPDAFPYRGRLLPIPTLNTL